MKIIPKTITRIEGKGLAILWTNGGESFINNSTLRKLCPCAHCAEERGELSHDKPIIAAKPNPFKVIEASAEESMRLDSVQPVGNYAISIAWGDGHSTGIYSFDYLRKLAGKD